MIQLRIRVKYPTNDIKKKGRPAASFFIYTVFLFLPARYHISSISRTPAVETKNTEYQLVSTGRSDIRGESIFIECANPRASISKSPSSIISEKPIG